MSVEAGSIHDRSSPASITPFWVAGGAASDGTPDYVQVGFHVFPAAESITSITCAQATISSPYFRTGTTWTSAIDVASSPTNIFVELLPTADITTRTLIVNVQWIDMATLTHNRPIYLYPMVSAAVTSTSWDGAGTTVTVTATCDDADVRWTWDGFLGNSSATATATSDPTVETLTFTGLRESDNHDGYFGTWFVTSGNATITWGGAYIVTGGCLLAGTRITMADGSTNAVEDIAVGDAVARVVGGGAGDGSGVRVQRISRMTALRREPYCIPEGAYGATAPLWLTRDHAFYASVEAYAAGEHPMVPGKEMLLDASLSPDVEATTPVTYYNLRLEDASVLLANGVVVVGMR